jgi:hypothetical protein
MTAADTVASADLEREVVPIERIKNHPDNKRKGDIGRIERSLRDHGQFRPILVQRSTEFALVGNHTLIAARNIGKADIVVDWIDCDDEQALEILLIDNRTSDGAEYDERGLAELLARLGEERVERAGFSAAEAHELARVTGLLADESVGFLDGLQDGEQPKRDPGSSEWHQLSWPVTATQRDTILLALKARKQSIVNQAPEGSEPPTTIDALVRLCQDYIDEQDGTL